MANNNSYSENMAMLTQAANEIVEMAKAMNESVTGNDAEVVITDDVVLPSYQNIVNRVERAERTMARFTAGKGVIEADDGSYRKIRIETISRPANDVLNVEGTSSFDIDPNWFFENMQYPRCVVKIDLAGKIEDDSDRVYVCRIIIDVNQTRITEDIKSSIKNDQMTYNEMIDYLENHFIEYKEDKDEIRLPLTYEKFNGSFAVTGINLIKNNDTGLNYTWYYLSTINYSTVKDDGTSEETGHILQVGDYLRFNNSLFRIKEINQAEMRVRLEYSVGYDTVGLQDTLEFYSDPFKEKIISVGISIDELDVIYIKGVNEKFNLLSREWSNPIVIDTNELQKSGEYNTNFRSYYTENVADFGKMLISNIKEGKMSAYGAKKPFAPILNEGDLRVVQINTQLNATLDSERYTSITSEIASVKSSITATRNTISANKNKIITEFDINRRTIIQNSITSDTNKLNNLTTQFSSLVDELNTLLNDADVIKYSPKYHVRGFFAIPDPQYTIDDGNTKIGKQEIIGFETMYRYLHTDETGSPLNTFEFTDSSNNVTESGVFTDWCITNSPILPKIYNSETDRFEWVPESLDGTHVTINQIDIPIRSGEKVEIKVRSISEAGYPYMPLKSDWSNSVIVSFPDNLMSNDSVTTILDNVKSDMTSVILQETLSAAGMYTHISDSNSRYKHNTDNIEYTEIVTDENGNTTATTMSLTDKLRSLSAREDSTESGITYTDTSTNTPRTISIKLPTATKSHRTSVNDSLIKFLNEKVIPSITRTT